MKLKGINDIPTAQTLISRSIPASRSKVVTQLARMEQERERLERELNIWFDKQQQTERRLQQVRQHIEVLRRALDELPADEEGQDSDILQAADEERQRTGDDGWKAGDWRAIPLEY